MKLTANINPHPLSSYCTGTLKIYIKLLLKVQCGGVHTFSPNSQKAEADFFITQSILTEKYL